MQECNVTIEKVQKGLKEIVASRSCLPLLLAPFLFTRLALFFMILLMIVLQPLLLLPLLLLCSSC